MGERIGRTKHSELHHFMVTAAKAAFDLHIPNEPFLVCMRSSTATLLVGSSIIWIRKLSSIAYALLWCPSSRYRGSWSPPGGPGPANIRLLRAPSNLTSNVSRDGASTTSLGNLFQYLTTLIATFKYWKAAIRPPRSLLFSRLNNPNSLSLSLRGAPAFFVALLWTSPNRSMSFLYWGPRSWMQYSTWDLTRAE
ncbi:LOW QUALITY PROTEIN: hypothetical protein QYF61_007672 [Mycteria americana]|uniref:Uncharacterized protein n=1 Tax=Mycteria americana TaxID=33587 RepID=A0AAN7NH97_MYCAM|nr:LOW QUALITY PROTEIN: hypothetical protein QYF61_007672 [Mycteria americana]